MTNTNTTPALSPARAAFFEALKTMPLQVPGHPKGTYFPTREEQAQVNAEAWRY